MDAEMCDQAYSRTVQRVAAATFGDNNIALTCLRDKLHRNQLAFPPLNMEKGNKQNRQKDKKKLIY